MTTAAVLMARAFGGSAAEVTLVGAAVLSGQLSIGWSNDAVDAERDAQVGRTDKPAASGALRRRTVWACAVAALAATTVASLALGAVPGAVHLLFGVAMGWAYNLGVKTTVLSPIPYAVAFGTLPSVAALAVRDAWAPAWLGLAGGGVGVAAHVANCLPDLHDDIATGVRGLPHRLGAAGSRALAAAVLSLAVSVVVADAGLGAAALAVVAGATLGCAGVVLRGPGRAPFLAIMGLAVLVVLLAADRMA